MSPLLLVAHGSPDPRAAVVIEEIADAVRRRLPCVPVGVGYLDHDEPRLSDELTRLAARGPVELLPLLFAPGFHADVDVPGVVDSVRGSMPDADVHIGTGLGAGEAVADALVDRLAEAGLAPHATGAAVALVAVGSTAAGESASRLAAAGGWPVTATTVDELPDAIVQLRAAGATTVAVSCLILAPGVFSDRIAAASSAADVVAAPIGAHPALIRLVAERASP